ncbi:uncharacterized protein METZ01_LOCUS388853, partial [marine metagenome]
MAIIVGMSSSARFTSKPHCIMMIISGWLATTSSQSSFSVPVS